MSITQKMIRDSCRSTWGADWWKTDKVSRKAIAALDLSGIHQCLHRLVESSVALPAADLDDEPILAIEDEDSRHAATASLSRMGISYDDYRRLAAADPGRYLDPAADLDDEPILAIEDEVQVCSICMEDAITNTTTTVCNHTFHSNCYTNYICSVMRSRTYGQITCPMCRSEICDIR
jgi:hypothetical protein